MPKAQSLKPKARSLRPKASAYIAALRMLGRRELSEAQVQRQLARKGHNRDDVDAAVERLRAERVLDDERVAEAIAHTEITVRRHGKLRIKRQMEQAGIAPAVARSAIDSAFEAIDDEEMIETALTKRLRGRDKIAD